MDSGRPGLPFANLGTPVRSPNDVPDPAGKVCEQMESGTETSVKKLSPCDTEALKKCLEEQKGDYEKCRSHIEAFKSSCSLKKPSVEFQLLSEDSLPKSFMV